MYMTAFIFTQLYMPFPGLGKVQAMLIFKPQMWKSLDGQLLFTKRKDNNQWLQIKNPRGWPILKTLASHHPQGGITGPRWKMSHFVLKKKLRIKNQNKQLFNRDQYCHLQWWRLPIQTFFFIPGEAIKVEGSEPMTVGFADGRFLAKLWLS